MSEAKAPAKKQAVRYKPGTPAEKLLLALCFGCTQMFFMPMDIYLGNIYEFHLPIKYVVFPMLACAAAVSVLVFAILTAGQSAGKKIYRPLSLLILGYMLAGYVQTLFFNSRMMGLTGDIRTYANMGIYGIINYLIFFAVFLLPLIFYTTTEKKESLPVPEILKKYSVAYLSGIMLFMQLTGTITSYLNARTADSGLDISPAYVSYDPVMSLSKEKNIVVFITDRMDGDWMDTLLENDPSLNDSLEGFTFYRNNVSSYCYTFPSICEMLTDNKYTGEDNISYLDASWHTGKTLPEILHDNGYEVDLLLGEVNEYGNIGNIEKYCDNIRYVDDYEVNTFGDHGIVRTLTDLSLAKSMPYILKGLFIDKYNSAFSNSFLTYNVPDRKPNDISADTDILFYDYLTGHGLNTDSTKPKFSVIHLNCAHDFNVELSALYPGYSNKAGDVDQYTTARGSFVIIEEYLARMKELGVFDNSVIIILGDHGRRPVEIESKDDFKDHFESPILTTLMIKPENAAHEPLKTNDTAQMSNGYFYSSIIDYSGIGLERRTPSYEDVLINNIADPRYMDVYIWRGVYDRDYLLTYKITGDAHDMDNWSVADRSSSLF